MNEEPRVRYTNGHWVMPGLATAHSHAFQRALRGRTQRRATRAGTFLGWRDEMYRLVERLRPDELYAIARFAYTELAMSGVTAVGEFHYVHHGPGGRPYAERTELADAVIRAARDAGIRICLIRTAYLRAGYDQAPVPAQERFIDPSIDEVLNDLDALRSRNEGDPHVAVAAAAHSVRAVPLPQVQTLAGYAERHGMAFHMHVSEQRSELEECRAEYGTTPVALLSAEGILSSRFVAVHATHLDEAEVAALGETRSLVCICRTTERDLGDGLPPVSELLRTGVPPVRRSRQPRHARTPSRKSGPWNWTNDLAWRSGMPRRKHRSCWTRPRGRDTRLAASIRTGRTIMSAWIPMIRPSRPSPLISLPTRFCSARPRGRLRPLSSGGGRSSKKDVMQTTNRPWSDIGKR